MLYNDQTLSAPDATQISWVRGGTSPEVSLVTFEQSSDSGMTWTPLGSGARVGTTSNWQLTGLSLPASGQIRARGRIVGSYQNGSSGLVESVSSFGTLPPPTVTAILPDRGTPAGGTDVTITGTNFTGATAATIGGTAATNVVVVDATTITATTPAGSLGPASVEVTTPGGTSAPNTLYTYELGDMHDRFVSAMVVQPDGKTLIAGYFTSVLGVPRNHIARLNADGTLDMGFDPNANSSVYSLAVQADGMILLGGEFTTLQPNGDASPTARNHVARLNADGTLDPGFDPNANDSVLSVAVQSDGMVLLGGSFSRLQPNGDVSPTARNFTARLNADGTLDPGFDPNANFWVNSVVVQEDGKILLGGYFTSLQPLGDASPTTRNYIARLNANGTLDTGFDPDASIFVYSVAVQADGKVLLGGAFASVGGTARNYLARLNPDGTVDTGFDPNPDSYVTSMAMQADGRILLGGGFTSVGGVTRNYAARVNADGTLDPGFDPNANDVLHCVAQQADGTVMLGGKFTTLQPDGAASPVTHELFAMLLNDAAIQTLSVPNAAQISWVRAGSSPEISLVTFEQSIDGGGTWTPLGRAERVGTTPNWQLTGLSLPASGQIRARGRTMGCFSNGSSG